MRFKSQQHKSTFKKAIRKKDKKDTRLMAAMYLLTADQILWNKVKGNIRESRIDFDEVRLDTVSENGYTLYSASKDMYFNTDHVSISDIFDTNLISEKMFNVIITAINIRRLGLEKAEAIECAGEILPVRGKIAAAVAELTSHRTQGERVYDSDGSAVTQTATGGGFGGKTGMYFIDMNDNAKMTEVARCITTRQDSGIGKHKGEKSGVFVEYDGVYPVINPDRETVRQNGPRIRPNGAPAFCLTVVDRHGVIHHGRVRRLVPQECFRLMGFEDSQFFKLQNELHLSDAKLYKLAGNSIIVPILADIMTNIKQVNAKYGIVKER